MKDLQAATVEFEVRLEALVELLEEAEERYWAFFLGRALERVRANQLSGVTQAMSAFQGEGTLSDLAPTSGRGTPQHVFDQRWRHVRDSVFHSGDQLLSTVAHMRSRGFDPRR